MNYFGKEPSWNKKNEKYAYTKKKTMTKKEVNSCKKKDSLNSMENIWKQNKAKYLYSVYGENKDRRVVFMSKEISWDSDQKLPFF